MFTGEMVDGGSAMMTANFTHNIPAGPVLLMPVEDSTVNSAAVVIAWEPVATDLSGNEINIVRYQVIVEVDEEEPDFPNTFAKPVFSLYLPADTTRVSVSAEFLMADTDYKYEVLAIEESGNQTLTPAEFKTE